MLDTNSLKRGSLFLSAWLAIAALACGAARAEDAPPRMNVLHIISDDLCARLACFGFEEVQSPNIDALAARGVRFERAYCQYPLCNPSRASFMTGARPDTTKVLDNSDEFRDAIPDVLTIPQSFRNAGYAVARVGKIYHYGVPGQIGTDGLDDPASWDKVVNPIGRDIDDIGLVEMFSLGEDGKTTTRHAEKLTDTGGTVSWLAADGTDDEQTDGKGAVAAIDFLEKFAAGDKPFYLAVGFYRPHTPYIAPKPYFDRYPRASIALPEVPRGVDDLFPAAALLSRKADIADVSDELCRTAIQAYYASTTFMDAQVGRVLDAVERLGLSDNTIVVFHSDHGYHLGEKHLWQKKSLFEESARVPFIIAVPGNAANGKASTRTVELLSLHRTLTDLCGVEPSPLAAGASLAPLVRDPEAAWEHAAYTQTSHTRKGKKGIDHITGRSVRTERWRYTEWNDGEEGVELYDHEADPKEMKNLAKDPDHADQAATMKALLHAAGEVVGRGRDI
ncbi:MAG: sulfatase-like hydrolase/transferase [Candidatus Hydrogenedens sp.]|nr:sulfatase-like hydrolase/transferase [Candidatus Hydrogenedens sp.]